LTGAIAASAAKLYHEQQHKQQLQQQLPLHEDEQQQEDGDDVKPNTAAAAVAEEHVFALAAEATTEAVQDVLHSKEQRVLQQRRQLLDSQLQQCWDQLQALGLAEF
jgi:predicted aconitase